MVIPLKKISGRTQQIPNKINKVEIEGKIGSKGPQTRKLTKSKSPRIMTESTPKTRREKMTSREKFESRGEQGANEGRVFVYCSSKGSVPSHMKCGKRRKTQAKSVTRLLA